MWLDNTHTDCLSRRGLRRIDRQFDRRVVKVSGYSEEYIFPAMSKLIILGIDLGNNPVVWPVQVPHRITKKRKLNKDKFLLLRSHSNIAVVVESLDLFLGDADEAKEHGRHEVSIGISASFQGVLDPGKDKLGGIQFGRIGGQKVDGEGVAIHQFKELVHGA